MNQQHAFALCRVIEKINVLIPAFEKSILRTASANKQIPAFLNQAKIKKNYLEVFSRIISLVNSLKEKVAECIVTILKQRN